MAIGSVTAGSSCAGQRASVAALSDADQVWMSLAGLSPVMSFIFGHGFKFGKCCFCILPVG